MIKRWKFGYMIAKQLLAKQEFIYFEVTLLPAHNLKNQKYYTNTSNLKHNF